MDRVQRGTKNMATRPFPYTTEPDVLRHMQDKSTTHCGRACAQMVIAALILDPPRGQNPLLPVTQCTLFTREHDHVPEDPRNPCVWYTHPDEMHALLREAPELQKVNLDDWRLEAYPRGRNLSGARRLIADAVLTLRNERKPAAITWDTEDHWVLIVGAYVDSEERLVLEVLDPLNDSGKPAPQPHRYQDVCAEDDNGRTYVIAAPFDAEMVIERHLHVGRREIPKGLKDYAGRCVGVLYGKPPDSAELDRIAKELFRRPSRQPERDRLTEIRYVAKAWKIDRLTNFLGLGPTVVAKRPVRGFESNADAYDIVSLALAPTNASHRPGLLAIFAPASGALIELRFTTARRAIESLLLFDDQPLLWSPRQRDIFASRYYPFVRNPATGRLTRLLDETVVDLPVQ